MCLVKQRACCCLQGYLLVVFAKAKTVSAAGIVSELQPGFCL